MVSKFGKAVNDPLEWAPSVNHTLEDSFVVNLGWLPGGGWELAPCVLVESEEVSVSHIAVSTEALICIIKELTVLEVEVLVGPETLDEFCCGVDSSDEREFIRGDVLWDIRCAPSAAALWAGVHSVNVEELGSSGDCVALEIFKPWSVFGSLGWDADAIGHSSNCLKSQVEGEVHVVVVDFGAIFLVLGHVETSSLEDLEETTRIELGERSGSTVSLVLWKLVLELVAEEVPFASVLKFDHTELVGRVDTVSEHLDRETWVVAVGGDTWDVEVGVRKSDDHVRGTALEDACVGVVIGGIEGSFGDKSLLMHKLSSGGLWELLD